MSENTSLLKTALYQMHIDAGAKMVPFAGYEMPVQYPLGVKKEHLHTREKAGLFDVSHMGQVRIHGETAASELEKLVPVDIVDLKAGCQRYALFTNEAGGVLDDLMVTNAGEFLYLVVNAACKEQDVAHLQQHLDESCELEVLNDYALLALQGPSANQVMANLAPDSQEMVFMTAKSLTIAGIECFVTRSGYTGEDGFEISVKNEQAEELAKALLANDDVEWIGLGARDSLRLEVGLCLYGHELDTETTPIESSLLWAISKVRRPDEERAGDYPGAELIGQQIKQGVTRKRVGIQVQGKMPIRDGIELFNANEEKVGHITSGGFGPSAGTPVAMGFVEIDYAQLDTELVALVRNKQVPVKVVKLPFVPQNYYRG